MSVPEARAWDQSAELDQKKKATLHPSSYDWRSQSSDTKQLHNSFPGLRQCTRHSGCHVCFKADSTPDWLTEQGGFEVLSLVSRPRNVRSSGDVFQVLEKVKKEEQWSQDDAWRLVEGFVAKAHMRLGLGFH